MMEEIDDLPRPYRFLLYQYGQVMLNDALLAQLQDGGLSALVEQCDSPRDFQRKVLPRLDPRKVRDTLRMMHERRQMAQLDTDVFTPPVVRRFFEHFAAGIRRMGRTKRRRNQGRRHTGSV